MSSDAGERWSSLGCGSKARALSVIKDRDGMVCEVDLGRGCALPLLGGATLALIAKWKPSLESLSVIRSDPMRPVHAASALWRR